MKPSKANLETLIDIVALLIKQGQMGRVNRDQPGELPPPGIGVGKPRGMPPPTSPEGRKWRDHPQTKLESTPAPTPEPTPTPEPAKRVRRDMYGKTVLDYAKEDRAKKAAELAHWKAGYLQRKQGRSS
jgi:hypothetical protein